MFKRVFIFYIFNKYFSLIKSIFDIKLNQLKNLLYKIFISKKILFKLLLNFK